MTTNANGRPQSLQTQTTDQPRRIIAIHDVWRIDAEWWREPISRCYYLVRLEDGVLLTIYHDYVSDEWFTQRA